ncbi:hypothetical protein [Micromonospora sp. LOL_023]|uniref:hypothetical protein n=1 Tax=Micromonospora sp. LOL_023 TaxID=3345418 RepID=UPI003A840965
MRRATARAPRTDRARAGLLLWGGWLLVTTVRPQPDWHPWLRIMVAVAGTAATVALPFSGRLWTRFALMAAGAATRVRRMSVLDGIGARRVDAARVGACDGGIRRSWSGYGGRGRGEGYG